MHHGKATSATAVVPTSIKAPLRGLWEHQPLFNFSVLPSHPFSLRVNIRWRQKPVQDVKWAAETAHWITAVQVRRIGSRTHTNTDQACFPSSLEMDVDILEASWLARPTGNSKLWGQQEYQWSRGKLRKTPNVNFRCKQHTHIYHAVHINTLKSKNAMNTKLIFSKSNKIPNLHNKVVLYKSSVIGFLGDMFSLGHRWIGLYNIPQPDPINAEPRDKWVRKWRQLRLYFWVHLLSLSTTHAWDNQLIDGLFWITDLEV